VLFLERLSPVVEQVDSSSGAIGNAVSHAIDELVTIIAGAPAGAKTVRPRNRLSHLAGGNPSVPRVEFHGDPADEPRVGVECPRRAVVLGKDAGWELRRCSDDPPVDRGNMWQTTYGRFVSTRS
jgi:hypothetical protein